MKQLDVGQRNAEGRWLPEGITPVVRRQMYQLSLLGATYDQMAEFFEISKSTLETWRSLDPTLDAAIRNGRIGADMEVAHAWKRKAVGYSYEEKTVISRVNKEGEMVVVREEVVTKHHAPDAFAAMKWLERRQRELWADVQKSELSIKYKGEMDVHLITEQLKDNKDFSIEELQMALKMGLTQLSKNAEN